MHSWVLDHFSSFPGRYYVGHQWGFSSEGLGTELIFAKDIRQSLALPNNVSDYQCVASISNESASNLTVVEIEDKLELEL